MFRTIILLTIILVSITVSYGQNFSYHNDYERILQRTKQKADSLYYPTLLSSFLKNDSSLSVYKMLCLMIGYTGRKDFDPYHDLKTEKLIYELNDSTRYNDVITVCDTFLKTHPLNQQAIIEKSYAFHKLGQLDSSKYYKEQFGRIMAAMDWSANGRSPDHAMFAIGPHDGKNFIDKYYRADLGRSGSDEDSHGNFCDILEMKIKRNGKEQSVVFFFVIQHAVNTTGKRK
jgi:hypothetical protein